MNIVILVPLRQGQREGQVKAIIWKAQKRRCWKTWALKTAISLALVLGTYGLNTCLMVLASIK